VTLLLAAATIEVVALGLWPTVFLLDSAHHFSEMFLGRYPLLEPFLVSLKSLVDWVFPGALWTWENLVEFFFQSMLVAFVAYALAAWRLAAPTAAVSGPTDGAQSAPRVGLGWILVPLLLFEATVVLVPGTMTTDIYNYALYGEMPVRYGANPFIHTPSEFPQNPLYYLIPLYWHDAPSVYGPLWVALSAGVAAVFRDLPLADELLAYRLIVNAAHLANTALVWALASRLSRPRAPSAALAYGWNPLLLVDFALNGHNDAVMLTLVLAGFLVAARGRPRASAVLLGLSVATKYTSVLVAPIALVQAARRASVGSDPPRLDVRALLTSVGAAAAVLVALYLPWVRGLDTFGPVLYWLSGPRLNAFAPEPALMSLAAWTTGLFGTYEAAWDAILAGFKVVAKLALAALIVLEAVRARAMEDVLAASARVSLAFLLLVNTWVMPWYYTWPLALCAPLGWQALPVRVCAGFTLTALVVLYQRQLGHPVAEEWAGLFLVLPLVLALGPAIRRRLAAGIAHAGFGGHPAAHRPDVAGAG
jgi:hypothetical protein